MNVDLLKEAYAVIDGVPDERLDLSDWKCGTVACAGGWLCQYPPFSANGLRPSNGGTPSFNGVSGYLALVRFFGLSCGQVLALFSPPGNQESSTDRQVFLRRLREFLRDRGAITAERCDELAALAEVRKA